MTKAVLFDLGGTLVKYYGRHEIPEILDQAITEVRDFLDLQGLLKASSREIWRGVEEENREAENNSVRPLEKRLIRIFQLENIHPSDALLLAMCSHFMAPIFGRGRRYDDSLPVFRELGRRGFKTAIVSNTSWGSPSILWREELLRQELEGNVDVSVFCRDVGWRKPARQIFNFTLDRLQVDPSDCIFVGDDPKADLTGPRAMGMKAILIDRRGLVEEMILEKKVDAGEKTIRGLHELLESISES